jgi:hypothetical protein
MWFQGDTFNVVQQTRGGGVYMDGKMLPPSLPPSLPPLEQSRVSTVTQTIHFPIHRVGFRERMMLLLDAE